MGSSFSLPPPPPAPLTPLTVRASILPARDGVRPIAPVTLATLAEAGAEVDAVAGAEAEAATAVVTALGTGAGAGTVVEFDEDQ
jgi:hypothetical protein